MIQPIPCKSCGEPIDKNYCPACGQRASVKRIAVRQLILDIPHAIFHLHSGFLYTVKQLFVSPGQAIREYLDGRRKPYFHPIAYLAILLLLNYVVMKITGLHFYDEQELLSMTPEQAKLILEYDATQWWFLEHTYLYMLIAIPACSLFYFLFFNLFKLRFNVAECAVVLMFIIAQGVLMQSIIYLLTGWIHNGVFIRAVEVVNALILLSYASYAMYNLLQPARRKIAVTLACIAGGAVVLSLMIAS